jgi:hypothetical protein
MADVLRVILQVTIALILHTLTLPEIPAPHGRHDQSLYVCIRSIKQCLTQS